MNPFMKLAIAEAKRGIKAGHGGPFGAVIVKDGKVIAKGHNRVVCNSDPTCHGEVDAIRRACKKLGSFDLSGCSIYTTGYPCPMCFGAILWSNMDRIYYGCNTTDTELIGFRDKAFEEQIPQRRVEMCEETDREACLALYRDYSAITDKTAY